MPKVKEKDAQKLGRISANRRSVQSHIVSYSRQRESLTALDSQQKGTLISASTVPNSAWGKKKHQESREAGQDEPLWRLFLQFAVHPSVLQVGLAFKHIEVAVAVWS